MKKYICTSMSITMIMIYHTHAFFYIICFAVRIDTLKEDCCGFITATRLTCKLIAWLMANGTFNFCVGLHLFLLCSNTLILNNILLKIFIYQLLYFTIIGHATVVIYKKYITLFIPIVYIAYIYGYSLILLIGFA